MVGRVEERRMTRVRETEKVEERERQRDDHKAPNISILCPSGSLWSVSVDQSRRKLHQSRDGTILRWGWACRFLSLLGVKRYIPY